MGAHGRPPAASPQDSALLLVRRKATVTFLVPFLISLAVFFLIQLHLERANNSALIGTSGEVQVAYSTKPEAR